MHDQLRAVANRSLTFSHALIDPQLCSSVLRRYTCPEIHWRAGQDLTGGEGGSFFEWFSHVPADDEAQTGGGGGGGAGGVDDDQADESDPDEGDWIADVIVRTLWPRAVEHYLGGLGDLGDINS
jgi:hypothetical protein